MEPSHAVVRFLDEDQQTANGALSMLSIDFLCRLGIVDAIR